MAADAKPELHRKGHLTARHRMQSELLVGTLGMLLTAKTAVICLHIHRDEPMPEWFWISCGVSAAFALLVWLLRAATRPAATMGGLVCLQVLLRQQSGVSWHEGAMPSLLALFLLTFGATRFGRWRKISMGVAECRIGRQASQVLANLGVAGLLAASGTAGSLAARATLAACIAALAEATADTVSSEMGQALSETRWGRPTRLITSGKLVAPGTDGGITLAGTGLGMLGAAVIILCSPTGQKLSGGLCLFAAACAGLLVDSLLGATLERKGWIGNDLVNLASTIVAAAIAAALSTRI